MTSTTPRPSRDRMTGKGFSNTAKSFQAVSVHGCGGKDVATVRDAALAEPIRRRSAHSAQTVHSGGMDRELPEGHREEEGSGR